MYYSIMVKPQCDKGPSKINDEIIIIVILITTILC